MEFFNYQIQLKENPKKESLNLKTYKEIIKFLSRIFENYMRKHTVFFTERNMQESNSSQSNEFKSVGNNSSQSNEFKPYILLTKQLKENFEQEIKPLAAHLIRFIDSYGGKISKKIYNYKIYNSEDVKRECVEEWISIMFSDYKERIRQVFSDYLEKEKVDPYQTLQECSKELAQNFFRVEDFLFLSSSSPTTSKENERKGKRDFLLENGQMIVGSNFDIDNWADAITRGVSSINEQTENNPWIVWLVVGLLLVIFIFFVIVFYFTFSFGR